MLLIQLSSPARALRLTTVDGETTLLDLPEPRLKDEHRISISLRDGTFTTLLSLEWANADQPNFLRFILEPESLTPAEVILHAPYDFEDHAVEFTWPDN